MHTGMKALKISILGAGLLGGQSEAETLLG